MAKMIIHLLRGGAALVSLALPQLASAASNGSLGATSTGTANITATIAPRVQISKLSEVTFNTVDPSAAVFNAQSVCVWSNTAGRKYNITASGNGASSAFTLSGGPLGSVPYAVEWAQTAGQNSGSSLVTGTALTGQASIATSPTCTFGAATSASLIIRMSSSTLQSMQAGATYAGALTLVVAPE